MKSNQKRMKYLVKIWWLGLYASLGFCAGLTNGLLGAAGGILLVSFLPYMPLPSFATGECGLRTAGMIMDQRDIFATALAVMLPVSVVSFLRYLQGGMLPDVQLISLIWLPAALGGLLGAWLLDRLSPQILRIIFSALILVSGVRMLF